MFPFKILEIVSSWNGVASFVKVRFASVLHMTSWHAEASFYITPSGTFFPSISSLRNLQDFNQIQRRALGLSVGPFGPQSHTLRSDGSIFQFFPNMKDIIAFLLGVPFPQLHLCFQILMPLWDDVMGGGGGEMLTFSRPDVNVADIFPSLM